MTKKLAIINDLSGFGRCSLTAAISVISTMGIQACPLPTAILSAQTGFPSYKCFDFTEQMQEIQEEWMKLSATFDGIYTGFVSSEAQIDNIISFVHTFYQGDTFLLVDPVMGDNGKTFAMFTPELQEKMKQLTKLADIITPNLTELCLLTNTDYHELIQETDAPALLNRIYDLGYSYCQEGPKQMVVTGIHYIDEDGKACIGNSYISLDSYYHTSSIALSGSYSGTGDLFASCLAAGIAKSMDIPHIMNMTNEFLTQSIADSVSQGLPSMEGVNFEKHLHLLR